MSRPQDKTPASRQVPRPALKIATNPTPTTSQPPPRPSASLLDDLPSPFLDDEVDDPPPVVIAPLSTTSLSTTVQSSSAPSSATSPNFRTSRPSVSSTNSPNSSQFL